MRRIGFALVPQHADHLAPLLRGTQAGQRCIEQLPFRADPFVDRSAAARIHDQPHRPPRHPDERRCKTARRPHLLHAQFLAHRRIAVQRFDGRCEAPFGIEKPHAGHRITGRSVERAAARHVRLSDAKHDLQPQQPHETHALPVERIAPHPARPQLTSLRRCAAQCPAGVPRHIYRLRRRSERPQQQQAANP